MKLLVFSSDDYNTHLVQEYLASRGLSCDNMEKKEQCYFACYEGIDGNYFLKAILLHKKTHA